MRKECFKFIFIFEMDLGKILLNSDESLFKTIVVNWFRFSASISSVTLTEIRSFVKIYLRTSVRIPPSSLGSIGCRKFGYGPPRFPPTYNLRDPGSPVRRTVVVERNEAGIFHGAGILFGLASVEFDFRRQFD